MLLEPVVHHPNEVEVLFDNAVRGRGYLYLYFRHQPKHRVAKSYHELSPHHRKIQRMWRIVSLLVLSYFLILNCSRKKESPLSEEKGLNLRPPLLCFTVRIRCVYESVLVYVVCFYHSSVYLEIKIVLVTVPPGQGQIEIDFPLIAPGGLMYIYTFHLHNLHKILF